MEKYYFTRIGYNDFMSNFNHIKNCLDEAIANKALCGSGSDTWHDEGFKIGIGEEMMWSKDFGKLQEIERKSVIIDPKEQNEVVALGNGIILEFDNKEIFVFIDGYLSKISKNRISIYSPMGKALFGKKIGDEIVCKIGNIEKKYFLKTIFLPSVALEKINKILLL